MTAKAVLVVAVRLPELKTTVSLAVGTCWGSQLVALFQAVEVEPFQVRIAERRFKPPNPNPITTDKMQISERRLIIKCSCYRGAYLIVCFQN
jgi:hypothetical protein